jgi:uncharacterized membrane protein required for colicin V production
MYNGIKMNVEVSSAVLLSLAVSLLSLGVSFLEQGNIESGIPCIIVGFGVLIVTVLLLEKGIISKLILEAEKKYGHTGKNHPKVS